MDNWDEIRTAYQVARLGTVSGAAEVLGVHHATVIRHIDALETRLGVKLFQRHARGYTPTEEGRDLARVAEDTDDRLQQLKARIKSGSAAVNGELLVTSLVVMAPMMVGALTSFQARYPDLVVRYLTDDRVFRLEYGEAHVAIRAGTAPQEPDNVVQKFMPWRYALYGTQSYLGECGVPEEAGLRAHRFVAHDDIDSRAPFHKWLRHAVPRDRVVFRATDSRSMERAVLAGAGLGFFEVNQAARHPELVQVLPPREEWEVQLWLVTHVDLHRTAKVQAFLAHLKAYASAECPS
ncbi:MAG: LysR family transcriptional regulator [Roseivivax sp.]|nr:LysR family transcriptional regulator [Roseivivax sp.]